MRIGIICYVALLFKCAVNGCGMKTAPLQTPAPQRKPRFLVPPLPHGCPSLGCAVQPPAQTRGLVFCAQGMWAEVTSVISKLRSLKKLVMPPFILFSKLGAEESGPCYGRMGPKEEEIRSANRRRESHLPTNHTYRGLSCAWEANFLCANHCHSGIRAWNYQEQLPILISLNFSTA